jgi:uncharacterized protein YfaS (alpha-2-macroglobulin family)
MRGMDALHPLTSWRLAAAYFLAGKDRIAKEMVNSLTTKVEEYNGYSYTYGSSERDQAMILETMVLMGDRQKAFVLLKELSKKMTSQRWMSTQTTAYCLLAAAKFIGTDEAPSDLSYELVVNGKKQKVRLADKPMIKHPVEVDDIQNGRIKIENNEDSPIFVNLVLTGTPLMGEETEMQNSLKVNVKYLSMNGTQITPDKIEQGSDFIAEITVEHPGIRSNYKEMVLDQIFPSGWEIRNSRMDQIQSLKIKDKPRYEDIRDDRVYSFFNISKGKRKTFRVLLNASYKGRFYLPSVKCGAMYDNTIESIIPGKWVEVVGVEE